MQDLVFDHSDPDKKSGEGKCAGLTDEPNTNLFIAMAYLVAILKDLRKDVLSRADSMPPIDKYETLSNVYQYHSSHSSFKRM